jgi:FkbM family methyltransferase
MKYGELLPIGFEIPKPFQWVLKKDLGSKNPFEFVAVRAGDKVMDCGSAVGTFAAAALESGASFVKCYEPNPKNAAVLRRNLARYGEKASVIEAALVADDKLIVELFGANFPGSDSIISRRDATKKIMARALCFRHEIAKLAPDVIKLDIESGEYEVFCSLRAGDLKSVSSMFIEFHPHRDRENLVPLIRRFLEDEGFKIMNERLRAFTANRWN